MRIKKYLKVVTDFAGFLDAPRVFVCFAHAFFWLLMPSGRWSTAWITELKQGLGALPVPQGQF